MTIQRIDEEYIRSEIKRYIRLEEMTDERGRAYSILSLISPVSNHVIFSEKATSLRAKRSYLEEILFNLVHNILFCKKCGSHCIGRDENVCCTAQVMNQ